MKNKSYRPNWPLRAACILLCMTMLSVNLISQMYARYSTSFEGDNNPHVAVFKVTDTGTFSEDLYLECYPGGSNTYTLVLENHSEVAVKCNVLVNRLSSNIPMELMLDEKVTSETMVQLAPNDTAGKTVNLKVNWNGSNAASYSYDVDAIRVTISSEQID